MGIELDIYFSLAICPMAFEGGLGKHCPARSRGLVVLSDGVGWKP